MFTIIFEYILLAVLLISAVAIIVAVTFQKSNEGLSGTIAGGSDNYIGKDKSASKGKFLYKLTLIMAVVFAVAVLLVYILQPDYENVSQTWHNFSEYSGIFS